MRRRELWLVGGFLFLYYFNPGFGTPLYYYMTDELRFSQQFIGILGAVSSAGWIAGALLYRWRLRGMTSQALLYLSIACGTAKLPPGPSPPTPAPSPAAGSRNSGRSRREW